MASVSVFILFFSVHDFIAAAGIVGAPEQTSFWCPTKSPLRDERREQIRPHFSDNAVYRRVSEGTPFYCCKPLQIFSCETFDGDATYNGVGRFWMDKHRV